MKNLSFILTSIIILTVVCNCQPTDSITVKPPKLEIIDSSNSLKFSLLAGIGSHQGVRVGACLDALGFRFGGGYGYGLNYVLVFFGLVERETTYSGFIEFPLKLKNNINLGSSYTLRKIYTGNGYTHQHIGLYINFEKKLTKKITFSFGVGYDYLLLSSRHLHNSINRDFIHIDAKIILGIIKDIL